MKNKILFAALNLMILSNGLQASLAHLPCNIAYTIAGLASSLADKLEHQEADAPEGAITALHDVKHAYNELGTHLMNSYYVNDDASLLFAVAAATLDQLHARYATSLMNHHDILTRMLILNERLSTGL